MPRRSRPASLPIRHQQRTPVGRRRPPVSRCSSSRISCRRVAMNVSAQHDSHVSGQVGGADYIRPEAESEIVWTTGRALYALVKAQHADVRRRVVATRLGEYPRKLTTNVVGIGEPDELDAYSVCF